MKLSPNIDRRGRRVRLIAGIILDLGAAALIIVAINSHRTGLLIGGIVTAVLGGFTVFEAANGWCLIRAMGIKTRL